MSELKLGTRTVGASHPTFIIAEIGINHQGDVGIAKELIIKAPHIIANNPLSI